MNNIFEARLPSLALSGLSAHEQEVFGAIHAAIVEQRLLPGTRLTEEELTEIYGISRMRIRRILLALAHTGMIELPPARGALVARPSTEEATQLFEARRLIEAGLLETPLTTPAAKEAKALRKLVTDEDEAAQTEDKVAMIRLSGRFHVRLALAYGNPVLAGIVAGLVTRSSLIIALYQTNIVTCCRSDDHLALLDLLASGNQREASTRMQLHLDAIEAGLDIRARASNKQDLRTILGSGNSTATPRKGRGKPSLPAKRRE